MIVHHMVQGLASGKCAAYSLAKELLNKVLQSGSKLCCGNMYYLRGFILYSALIQF